MSSTLYFQRHGLRLDIYDSMCNTNIWNTSVRIKEHFNDMPLADPYERAISANAPHINTLDAIYTSPATRCIETSVILQRALALRNITVPIYVEYGLMEVATVNISKLNQHYIYDEIAEPIICGDTKYTDNVDNIMLPDSVKARFPTVNPYKSMYNPDDIPFVMSYTEWGNRMTHIVDTYSNMRKNILICGHAGTLLSCVPYVVGHSINKLGRYTTGDTRTGTMAKCKDGDVIVYQNGKAIFSG